MLSEIDRAAAEMGATHVVQFVETNLGGTVVAIERIPRWRAGWYLTLERDGERIELYARGERGPDFPSPFDLGHEARVHDLLESNGVPVPHVYGLAEGPVRTLIMARVPGQQGLALARDDATRRALMTTYIGHMARIHHIDGDRLRAAGFRVPTDPIDVAMSEVFRNVETKYLLLGRRDPLIEFLRSWMWRNPPERTRSTFVTWDSAQFLQHEGELTALIDFELAHVGDAYMDLAALRTRDSIEPLGDLRVTFAEYERLMGEPIDFQRLRFYEISQLTVTLMLQFPVLIAPDPESDYVTHLTWYIDSARYALDIMAELFAIEIDTVDVPPAAPSTYHTRLRHLVTTMRTLARSEPKTDLALRHRGRPDHRRTNERGGRGRRVRRLAGALRVSSRAAPTACRRDRCDTRRAQSRRRCPLGATRDQRRRSRGRGAARVHRQSRGRARGRLAAALRHAAPTPPHDARSR